MITKNANTIKRTKQPEGWHKADVKAALEKRGYSFARIAREHGYVPGSPNMVLHKPWSQIERIISHILDIPAHIIWPDRYDRHGRPLKERTARINSKTQ